MNKKRKLIVCISLIVILVCIGIKSYKNSSYYIGSNGYITSQEDGQRTFVSNTNLKRSGNSESFDFKGFSGKWSLIELNSSKNNKITIENSSKITSGKLYIAVLDSNYNLITKKNLKEETGNLKFTTSKSGKYIIRIVGKDASGNFNIKINSSEKINVTHKDFFG